MLKNLKTIPLDLYNSLLNSYSMVFFSRSHVFAGIMILVSFFDPVAGLSGIVAVLSANLAAYFIGLNRLNILSGMYAFNALLVGLGTGVYFQWSAELFILLVFSSLLTVFLSVFFEGMIGKYNLPFLTLPFLISFWLVMLAARRYTGLDISERGIFTYNEVYDWGGQPLLTAYNWFNELRLPMGLSTYFKSLSAIFFQYHLLPGILIAIGLMFYSRIAFILSLLGFYSAYLYYQFIGANFDELNYSFIGFNFILTAIAVGGYFIIPSKYSFLWIIFLTPVISILISSSTEFLITFQLSTYSLPFNIIVLLFLYLLRFRQGRKNKLDLVVFQEYSPEKNLYSQHNSRTRFRDFFYLPFGLPFLGEWQVTQGHRGEFTHKEDWQHAWDFEVADEKGKTYSGDGNSLSDFYSYNKPVLACADGWIEEIASQVEDNQPGDINIRENWGNTIIIKHLDGLYSKVSHLKKESICVEKGAWVKKGDKLALCGNSGRSPKPHIHFQIQSTPYIGSTTLDYPLGRYIKHESGRYSFQSWEKPQKGDILSNIEKVGSISRAFHFIPGQHLIFKVAEEGKADTFEEWVVETDIYNYTYLNCQETGSKAYFRSEQDLHYFTAFSGDRSSLLYSFYLTAYKVALGFYPNLQIKDEFPLHIMNPGPWKILQDFVAPFYLFIRSEYSLDYISMNDELDRSGITLRTKVEQLTMSSVKMISEGELFIGDGQIDSFSVNRKGRKITARQVKNRDEKIEEGKS